MKPPPDRHNRHRFSAEIIGHAVWLYHVFRVSLRNVELLLAECPVAVAHETVRYCCKKFGASFADGPCRCRPRPGDKWGIAAGRHPPHFSGIMLALRTERCRPKC